MARLAFVLGLLMVAGALLTLSLLGLASERAAMTPSGPRNSATRLAGRKNSNTHRLRLNLQELKHWTLNPAAVQHQRTELASFVDVSAELSLTRSTLLPGQLLHFDYSPQHYVFVVSAALHSLLPISPPFHGRHFNSCAVVGNGGVLTGSGCGQRIDTADFVIRCNFAPTTGYVHDVGNRTSLTTFNPSIVDGRYGGLLTADDRERFLNRLQELDGAVLWIPAFLFHTSAVITRTLVDFFLENKSRLGVQLAWPGPLVAHITRFWRTRALAPKRLSTGMLMYSIASALCDEISLYGFWPFAWEPISGRPLPYHYYARRGARFTTAWQEAHQLPGEFRLFQQLHGQGALRLHLGSCT
uniref:alpha-N-acetylneuraminate alpha-2,8-sialyltransferase ST8SIA3 n=1 Tax=Myxine glutinosa TaxID=7769 RepID=UPI00358F434C